MKKIKAFIDRLEVRLARRSSYGPVIGVIDGLRFLAILLVILHHTRAYTLKKLPIQFDSNHLTGVINLIGSRGYIGVQLFFAISGFILALPLFRSHFVENKKFDLKKFYLRRIKRIEPPYIINLSIIFLLLVLVNGESFVGRLPDLLGSIFYIENFFNHDGHINPVTWSLEVEVQFYILVPLLGLVFKMKNNIRRRAMLILWIVVGSIYAESLEGLPTTPSLMSQFHFFITGMLAFDFYYLNWQSVNRKLIFDLAGLGGLVGLMFFAQNWRGPFTNIGLSSSIFMIFASVFCGQIFPQVFGFKWISIIGGMCYSIYLYHHYVMSLVGRLSGRILVGNSFEANYIFQNLIMIPIMLIVSGIFFVVFEKPFMADTEVPKTPIQVKS